MFSKDIVRSDAFLDMPKSSQLLYFHLGMEADDDGLIDNGKTVSRIVGTGDDDFKILFAKRFLLHLKEGLCVVKHWKINNYIQKDRYHETKYIEDKKRLTIKDNGAYTECIQESNKLDTETSLELGKTSQDKEMPPKGDIVTELLEEGGKIQHDYQFLGLEVFEKTGAPQNKKAECIRLAKLYPNLINSSLSFCLDYPNPALKWKMFLWKLNNLRKENATHK